MPPSILLCLLLFPFVSAFNFTLGQPSQCDNLTISWSGGRPPFQLLIIPPFNLPLNISIPANAFNTSTSQGFFQTQLPVAAGRRILVSMSDASGFGSGGVSDLLTTGASISGATCNTTAPQPEFFFELNTALQQCRPYIFSNYRGAIQPVTIQGFVPLGNIFTLLPPKGPTKFSWTANVAYGTSLVFVMTDAAGRHGGSSDIVTVGWTNEGTCLNASSPASTASPSSSTSSVNSPSATALPLVNASKGLRVSPGTIAGAVIGAVVLTALLIFLVAFCLLRRKRMNDDPDASVIPTPAFINNRRATILSTRRRNTTGHSVDLLHNTGSESPPSSDSFPPRDQYEPNPFIMPSEPSAANGHSESHDEFPRSPSDPGFSLPVTPRDTYMSRQSRHMSFAASTTSDGARRKAQMAGLTSYQTPRFILHTDADDESVDEPDVVELPPQYAIRKGSGRSPPRSNSDSRTPPESGSGHEPATLHGG
ncbi:hypothetical protein BD410DRAFT_781054 [Rickenella mellea]|uniref:Mid2 domain-containing protein n=1 Tax=Rickenella mellea TaxID=50990 RepID=A0A4Y7QN97_9AGAM|nr:hypothetical protein BD410DRAFT_781054 [Rickenella mellea]